MDETIGEAFSRRYSQEVEWKNEQKHESFRKAAIALSEAVDRHIRISGERVEVFHRGTKHGLEEVVEANEQFKEGLKG